MSCSLDRCSSHQSAPRQARSSKPDNAASHDAVCLMQGCRIKGKAEKAVFGLKVCCGPLTIKVPYSTAHVFSQLYHVLQLQAELQQHLQLLLKQSGVQQVQELLSVNIAKDWPRTARVNLLRTTVAEALAWLRSPPPEHNKWSRLVNPPNNNACTVSCMTMEFDSIMVSNCRSDLSSSDL